MNIIKKGTDSIITTIAFVIAFIWLIPLIWMIGTAFTEPSFSMSLFPILVNKPLRYRGWYIYQLSYNREQGRWSTMSELELVKDDWLYGVYTGIGLLLIGAAMLFLGPIPASTQAKREDHD